MTFPLALYAFAWPRDSTSRTIISAITKNSCLTVKPDKR